MIITVTFNPAVDKTIRVSNFKLGNLNRVSAVRQDPGGKGINVSRAVANLGGDTLALGFLGGTSGQFIADSLAEMNIPHDFTWLSGTTRTNIKLVDPAVEQETEINEPGIKVDNSQLQRLKENLLGKAEVGDYVVLTGSLPPGAPADTYAELITELQAAGSKVILDTSGQPLEQGLEAEPYLIKPNRVELETLVKQNLTEIEEIIAAGKKLCGQGIEVVVVSLGAEGAVTISSRGVWKTTPPSVEPASTVGAGDTLVGALILKLSQGKSLESALTYATAASAGSVLQPGTQLCTSSELEKLLPQTTVTELERGEL